MSRRPWRSAAILAAAALLLSGCATLPVSSPVQTAPPQVEQDDPGFFYQPNPPAENASPENIVRSFVQAASAGGDYTVAKEFLTADAAATWDPDESVVVHTASWTTTALATDRVRLQVPASALVTASGFYTPSSQSKTRDFELTQVRGQWRISKCPNGVVLAQPAFERVFKAASLQFFDAGYQRFVPDPRWFPTRSDRSPDIVRALLAGQSSTLASVTRTAFPATTELLRPVRISAGRLAVDVVIPGGQPDQQATDRMQQQIAASVVVPASTVRLTVNGRAAPVAAQADLEQLSVTGPLVVSGGRFGAPTGQGAVQEVRGLGPLVVAQKPKAVTYSARQNLAAVLTSTGKVAVVDRQHSKPVGASPIAPTLDQRGWTYFVPTDDPSGLSVADAAGRTSRLASDLGGTGVLAIEVSADGTRLLVLLEGTTGSRAFVAGIERDADGRPTGLTNNRYPVALDAGGPLALDATWVDQTSVAVLTAGAVQNVIVQQLGGTSSTLAVPRDAHEVVGATSPQDLRVLVGTGAVLKRSSNDWSVEIPSSSAVSVLAVQR